MSTASAPIIAVNGLTKHYRVAQKAAGLLGVLRHLVNRRFTTVEAVRGIDFTIQPGEIVGFLGPNGAGKTTVLKMLSGLVHPTAGQAQVVGFVPFERRTEFLRQITLVMGQKQQLIWDLPARDSYRVNAAIYDIPDRVARARVDELATLLAMEDNLGKPVRKLSLGERMKAELIAALLHEPQVLFLDEPTLGLDVTAQDTVRRFLREYCRARGATILLTSHYMADITALCERVLIIDQGQLRYDGRLAGIIERFAPLREVRLELAAEVSREQLAVYGELEALEGRSARLLLRRERLAETVAALLVALPVADLTVSDPPIEEVIARVFAGEAIAALDPTSKAEASVVADGAVVTATASEQAS